VSIKSKIILVIISVLLLGTLIASGCTGGVRSRGWAGGAVSDGKLFVASMTGKIIAIDAVSGTILGKPVQLLATTSGGLSCLPSSCGGASTSAVVIYASPAVQGQVVYVGGTDFKIYGYTFVDNAFREDPEWLYPRQGTMSGAIIGGIIVANDRVYFATSDGMVYALNANGLYKEWTYKIDSKIWSAPVVDGNILYIGSLDKKIYALNATDGTKLWEYEAGGAISSTPIVYDNKVYIGDYDRQFYALDAKSGNLVWKFPSDIQNADNPQNWFWAKPVIVNSIIYAPCLDGNVYALDASNGNLVHKFEFGDSISSSPVVISNSVVVATSVATSQASKQMGKVYIINTLDKSQKELDSFAEGINAPLFVNGDVVYVHTTKDNLYGINILTKTRQTFSLSTVK
jgi:eukaryotic-like serine/threonine-protein kinase